MEFDTGKAVITVVIGWVIIFVIVSIFGVLGLGVGALAGAFG
jgi:TM2 domain-containing membrane protein YozV